MFFFGGGCFFYWSLIDFPGVSRTLLSILANLNHAVICMVAIIPMISISTSLFSKPFGTVLSESTTIGITVTVIFTVVFFFSVIIIIIPYKFLTPALSDGLSLKSKWRYVSAGFQGYFLLFYYLRVFHISYHWWFFTRVWMTASLLKFPGFFSVFWPISIML